MSGDTMWAEVVSKQPISATELQGSHSNVLAEQKRSSKTTVTCFGFSTLVG
jgi:hypothetical protein